MGACVGVFTAFVSAMWLLMHCMDYDYCRIIRPVSV